MATLSSNRDFQRFKAVCVPILGAAKLTPKTIPTVSSLLSTLLQLLRDIDPSLLDQNFISYVFFPLKAILERNVSSEIPDQILEKLLLSFSVLCDAWWWTFDLGVWKQMFILCGSVIGGLEAKGKSRARDEETKEAAVKCLTTLLRRRSKEDATVYGRSYEAAHSRHKQILEFATSPSFVPIIGQSLDYILGVTLSPRPSLQSSSLQLLHTIIDSYAPEDLIPTVLPGVASSMTKVCLGFGPSAKKGSVNGDIVAAALKVFQVAVIKALNDEVCLRDGALPRFENLEDLASFGKSTSPQQDGTKPETRPGFVTRSESWLRATASQLHIAINSLHPLVRHSSPAALYGIVAFATEILSATPSTLPQTQPLLLSFLLSTGNSEYPQVAAKAIGSLKDLLSTPSVGPTMIQQLAQITTDNLSALPRLLSSQSDTRIQHVAEMITSVCRVGSSATEGTAAASISKVIGKLLGPTGGIEKWGWSLLSALEFVNPSVTVTQNSSGQLMLESNPATSWVPFPELLFKNISLHGTRIALETMLRALGSAGGDSCLYSVDWFIDVGTSNIQSRSVAALWCACRLLEGIADIQLSSEASLFTIALRKNKRLEKQVRAIARNIAELWDRSDSDELQDDAQATSGNEELDFNVQHTKGLVPLDETLKITQSSGARPMKPVNQPILHRGLCLQLIAIAAGVLQSRFDSLFIFSLYPILHSIVSSTSFLSSSGLAALNYVTIATSYASPANLLLSNFDYALDSVSRRLTRRWLDVDATRVLVVLIRLVGRDVVDKASDVVEECFDRLDAFHGYTVIVDGLVEVLLEVLRVIEIDVKANPSTAPEPGLDSSPEHSLKLRNLDALIAWLPRRFDSMEEKDETDYGPAPREAWGQEKKNEGEEDEFATRANQDSDEPPATSSQLLTKQIIARSLYFLTHESPTIRARILVLLRLSVPVLPQSALLPSINNAWPFILNRLADHETFVVSAAANLVEALAVHAGSFMYRRIWDDVWPRFQTLLGQLKTSDSINALSRRTNSAVGTESAYTHSHRLYRSLVNTMMAVMRGVHAHDPSFWDALVLFRRFLNPHVHEELQQAAKKFYLEASTSNSDAVWLVLETTVRQSFPSMYFMYDDRWNGGGIIVQEILAELDSK